MRDIISQGLYQDNLSRLVKKCRDYIDQNPLLYFTLLNLFSALEKEYDDQYIPIKRYARINEILQEKLIKIVPRESVDNNTMVGDLNDLIKAYLSLGNG